jgi:acyl transferase domain-containing protein/acyl carrier protein
MDPTHGRRSREPIAIVGMGCRFPGGIHGPESFWRFLLDGGDAIDEVPADRWNVNRLHGKVPGAAGRIVSRRGGFLADPAGFDAGFFGISPREAARMDPQQRWLLELTWETLEDAGISPAQLRGSATGVFLGISNSDYGKIQQAFPEQVDGYSNSGNALSIASNRLAFWYDWRGPALSIDTACSSSLVAVDRACRSLWNGECAMAMAGGVSAIFLPDGSIGFSKAGMLSPDGLSRAFDARANGYVRSEGAGLVLLKPLSQALADGDRIHATILASVVNQDGRTSSMTVPSIASQSAMLEEVLREAEVAPAQVVYVEAHGTGTPVGDPIEARALGGVLARGRKPESPCLLGSVKTNLGHLEPASGIAGLIKAALIVREGRVPASLHYRFPNPHIEFEALRLRVVTEAEPLPRPQAGEPLVVVNSFGFGGTNAQCLLSPPPPSDPRSPEGSVPLTRPWLLPLSAATEDALSALVSRYEAGHDEGDARSICLAAAVSREALKHRLVLMGANSDDLLGAGGGEPDKRENSVAGFGIARAGAGVVMVFTGQGAQHLGMARGLFAEEPVFARRFDEVAALFHTLSGVSLREELLAPAESSRLDETEIAQPALFAIQCGLIALWGSWGIRPAAVTGHSLGEVAAAFAAGIFDLPEAVRLVYHRSRLQGRARGGGMAAVAKTAEAAAASLAPWAGRLDVSAWNSPSMVTVAGEAEALEAYLREEAANGVFVRRLPGDYAFHTSAMDGIGEELREALADLLPRPVKIPFFSTVTGGSIAGESLDAGYWWRNVREPVRFAPAITSLVEAGYGLFLEVGPHPALASGIRETLANESVTGAVIGSLHRDHPDAVSLARAFASLWIAGATPDWQAYLGRTGGRRPRLPHYPWQHQPYWIESPQSRRERLGEADHPLLGVRRIEPAPAWEILLDPRSHPYLNDHRFWNRLVFPAAAFTEMMLAAGRAAFPGERVSLEQVSFERFLFLSSEAPPTLRLELDEDSREVRIHSRGPDSTEWQVHARGRVVVHPGSPADTVIREIRALRRPLSSHLAHWDFYEAFAADGYEYGQAFQGIEQAWHAQDEALAEIVMPEALEEDAASHLFHPALLDACLQTVRAAMERDRARNTKGHLWLPVSLAGWILHEPPDRRFLVHARIVERCEDRLVADLECLSLEGCVIAVMRGFGLAKMAQGKVSGRDEPLYERRWIPCEVEAAGIDPDRSPKTVLLLADRGGMAERLSDLLAANGIDVVRSLSNTPRGRSAPGDLAILHLAPLDHPCGSETDLPSLHEAERSGVHALLDLAHELQTQGLRARILTVMRGEAGATCAGVTRPVSASLEGFLRVAAAEMPESRWSSLILEPEETSDDPARTVTELKTTAFESEVAWHEGRRYVARLAPVAMGDLSRRTHPARLADGTTRAYALEIGRAGTLDGLELNEVSRQPLRAGEIEVRVAAAGVNFRDLLKILNRYPGTAEECRELGDDFAGEVIQVGPEVIGIRAGDLVAGVARAAFRTHLVVEASRVLPVPPGMTAEEAATLPTTFLTAHHALCDLARLQPGESVLIHAAAGGVGLAAIQVAQNLGLEIFATAGSEEKRDYLRELGVPWVMDSRSLDFVEQVREYTGGRGVDAVLNSLSGEFLRQSLGLLAPFGRFLEIGKIDLHADRPLGMGALRDCLSFFVIDMDRFLKTRPADAARLFQDVSRGFDAGHYRPLPFQAVPAGEAKTVFQEMARGRHLGKRLLDFRGEDLSIGVPRDPETRFREDRTYLVTGGHSGFGFETAKWLAVNGAKHLALLSRSGPRDEAVLEGLSALIAKGIRIHDLRADLTDPASLARALATLRASAPPLGGVIHAAMVLEDRFLAEHDRASFALAFDPKARGGWLLHEATRDDPLEHFIVYSSIAAIAGSPRQANYAAGNTFLEGLVRYRRQLGLPGLALQWGALSGSGFVERNEKTLAFLEKTGSEALPVDEALAILGQLLDHEVETLTVARVDWATMARYSPTIGRLPLYRELPGIGDRDRSPRLSLAHLLAASPDRQLALVEDFLAAQIAAVFGTEVDTLDRETPVTRMGLDSLMAIELLNRIEAALGIPFPMGAILSGPTVRDLAPPVLRQILERMPAEESGSPPA